MGTEDTGHRKHQLDRCVLSVCNGGRLLFWYCPDSVPGSQVRTDANVRVCESDRALIGGRRTRILLGGVRQGDGRDGIGLRREG